MQTINAAMTDILKIFIFSSSLVCFCARPLLLTPYSSLLTPSTCLLFSVFSLKILAHAFHGTELAAHGADIGMLRKAGLAQSARLLRIDGELDLSLPVEPLAPPRHLPVPFHRALHAFRDVRGMRRDP